jgi:UDP-N-acetylmuramoyl-L-alanyl-D-glutamate--2,6-diaminopimelate ligase
MAIVCDSQLVKPTDTFLVMPKNQSFIEEAKQKGATILFHPYPEKLWSCYAKSLYSQQPDICVAVTGTNGKTSVVSMLRQIWEHLGHKAGSFGTTGYDGFSYQKPLPSLTTLDAMNFFQMLDTIAGDMTHFAFEASSHGLSQYRLHNTKLAAACFTNLTQDHLDYHETMESYFEAKKKLFTEILPKESVINVDDPYGLQLPATLTYAMRNQADLSLKRERFWELVYLGKSYPIPFLTLSAPFQLYNILAAVALALVTGEKIEDIVSILPKIKAAQGRFEHVLTFHNADIYVDYAHTPDALQNILLSAKKITHGDLWVVFGCGGDRDRFKRPIMGKIASEIADYVVVTDDNPRFEDPKEIRAEVLRGCHGDVYEIANRRHAIAFALSKLKPNDVLIIAGKGHETSQIIQNINHPFCDRSVVIDLAKK